MERPKVMIVEDEAISAMILEDFLTESGYDVIGPVSGGREAISLALATKPNLILMDIMLDDDIDGIEATIEIHKIIDIPVLYLTASNDKLTYARAEKTKLSGILIKPFQFSKLKKMIDQLL
jgi:CheY-like chemotaxis protein